MLGMAPEPDAYRREEALRAGAEEVLTMAYYSPKCVEDEFSEVRIQDPA